MNIDVQILKKVLPDPGRLEHKVDLPFENQLTDQRVKVNGLLDICEGKKLIKFNIHSK